MSTDPCGYRVAAYQGGQWGYVECDLKPHPERDVRGRGHHFGSFTADGGEMRAADLPDEADFGLVMPFVGVASKGGPYDDDAYTAGYEAGLLDARLRFEKPPTVAMPFHACNVDQLDLIAMHRGYRCETIPETAEGWVFVTLTRIDDAF